MRTLLRTAIAVSILATLALSQDGAAVVNMDHALRRIAGVVQNPAGEPVPNIDVEVFLVEGHVIQSATRTDSHGKFSVEKLAPGNYEIWISYKPHPVFRDVIYKVTVDAKGSKEPLVVKLQSLSSKSPTT